MAPNRSGDTVERKIHFFRADAGVNDGGIPVPFDPRPALEAIQLLPFTNDRAGRYQFDEDGNAVCVVEHSTGDMHSVRFCRVRRSGLPQLERAGSITDLDLTADTGLLETVHVVFFPDLATRTTIVGAEYNHFGPRISRLGYYLYERSGRSVPHATFSPLLRGDAVRQLDRLGEIRLLDIGIRPAFRQVLQQRDRSLSDAFEAMAGVVDDPETLQIVIKPQPQARRSTLERLLDPLRGVLDQDNARQGLVRLQARGKCDDTGRVETIDLLKDHLISTKRIMRLSPRGRALSPASAFQAIRDAYVELEDSIHVAVGASS